MQHSSSVCFSFLHTVMHEFVIIFVILVFRICVCVCVCMGHAVVQLVEALCYKPEGREFDSQSCHWNFSLT